MPPTERGGASQAGGAGRRGAQDAKPRGAPASGRGGARKSAPAAPADRGADPPAPRAASSRAASSRPSSSSRAASSRPAPPSPAAAGVRVDGERILGLLREAVTSGAGRPAPASEWKYDPLLDKIFVMIIREFVHRNNYATRKSESRRNSGSARASGTGRASGSARRSKTTRGGGAAEFRTVLGNLRAVASETIPVHSGSEQSCIAAYKNKKELGSGKNGTTFAFDAPDGSRQARYALKVIAFNSLTDPKKYDNVVKEVEVQKLMGEAGIAPRVHAVHYCMENGGATVMIVMDLMTAGDINDFTERRAVTDEHRDIILGKVRRMHELGYCHRDLHSGNIFVTEKSDGRFDFFIGDFGYVKELPADEAGRRKYVERDLQHAGQIVSYVNRDHLRALLYGMVRDGTIRADVDMRITHGHSADCDWDHYTYATQT